MATNSDVKVVIRSVRYKKDIVLRRLYEYDVDLDLDTDADGYDIVLKNPNGMYTGLICRFDDMYLYVGTELISKGSVDRVTYSIDEGDSNIRIIGRDLMWKLVDNHALPKEKDKVYPQKYIQSVCESYGLKHDIQKADVYKKLVTGCGESEVSIMNNILSDSKQRIWYEVDTVKSGAWGTGKPTSYTFVYGRANVNGIKLLSVQLDEDGTDMESHVILYGGSSGESKKIGEYKNQYLIKKGILKRHTKRNYSDNASSKYKSIAQRDVRDSFRDDTQLTVTTSFNNNIVYKKNTTARVVIPKLGIDSVFFIKRTQYTKSIDNGSIVTLTMIPSDTLFERMWNSSTGITVTRPVNESFGIIGDISDFIEDDTNYRESKSYYFRACTNYTGCSLVDALKSIGVDSSLANRKKIAKENHISNYKGSAKHNTIMLDLLKEGKLSKPI